MTTPPGPQDTNTRQAIPSRWAVVTAAAAGSFMLAWAVELWLVVLAIHRPHTTHPTATALIPTTTARRGPPWPLGNAPDDPTGQLSLDGAAERAVSDAPASNDTAKGALVPPRRVTASRRWRLTSIPRRSRDDPASIPRTVPVAFCWSVPLGAPEQGFREQRNTHPHALDGLGPLKSGRSPDRRRSRPPQDQPRPRAPSIQLSGRRRSRSRPRSTRPTPDQTPGRS
jgi:hypothetical protein